MKTKAKEFGIALEFEHMYWKIKYLKYVYFFKEYNPNSVDPDQKIVCPGSLLLVHNGSL